MFNTLTLEISKWHQQKGWGKTMKGYVQLHAWDWWRSSNVTMSFLGIVQNFINTTINGRIGPLIVRKGSSGTELHRYKHSCHAIDAGDILIFSHTFLILQKQLNLRTKRQVDKNGWYAYLLNIVAWIITKITFMHVQVALQKHLSVMQVIYSNP